MAITLEAVRAAGGIVHSDGNIFFRDISMLQGLAGAAPAAVAPQGVVAWMHPETLDVISDAKKHEMSTQYGTETRRKAEGYSVTMAPVEQSAAAPALEAPPAVAPQGEYPHEQMDAMALARYKVVPSHASMLWSHAVVAGDGAQQLYVGREVECQNMARKFAGAFLDGAFAFHSMAAAPTAQAAPALEAPAAPVLHDIDAGVEVMAWLRENRAPHSIYCKMSACLFGDPDKPRAALAAAPQAPAAPSAVATQVIENLLQLARIVNTAVEDWGESFEDGSMEVTFHKEEADAMEAILEFFDSLPDPPEAEGVILSGPSRAERVLRSMAAPAAPAVDASFEDRMSDWAHADSLDAARYRWLRDTSVPPHNFYLSVPDEFKDERYSPREVDAAIDAAIAGQAKEGGA